MILEKELTLFEAQRELEGIENKINLYETLRNTSTNVKATQLKDVMVDGGKFSNEAIFNAINKRDDYTDLLQSLYKSKNAYEKYILDEIDRLKLSQPAIVIGFLKDYKHKCWNDIVNIFDEDYPYSYSQIRRFYDEYKGRTTKENSYFYNFNKENTKIR